MLRYTTAIAIALLGGSTLPTAPVPAWAGQDPPAVSAFVAPPDVGAPPASAERTASGLASRVIKPGAGSDLAAVQTRAVRDGDAFIVEHEVAEAVKAADADGFGVARELRAVIVVVAPDERRTRAGETVDQRFAADVAAMNKEFGACAAKELGGGDHRVEPAVRVAENAQEHDRIRLQH